jgi:hypothetical protein
MKDLEIGTVLNRNVGHQSYGTASTAPAWPSQSMSPPTMGGYETRLDATPSSNVRQDPVEREPKDKITQKGLYKRGVAAHGRIRGTGQQSETLNKGKFCRCFYWSPKHL